MSTVGVVIPFFQHEAYIAETLESVCAQTRLPDEVVLVEDGSPVPPSVADFCSRLPLRVLSRSHRGLAGARNAGIAELATSFVIPLDSDDRLSPRFIEDTLQVAMSQAADVVYTDIRTFDQEQRTYEHPDFDFSSLCLGNYIVATSLIRRSVWQAIARSNGHGYDPALSRLGGYEDYLFYLEAAALGFRFAHLPAALFEYRRRAGSMLSVARSNFSAIRCYIEHQMQTGHGIAMPHLDRPGEP